MKLTGRMACVGLFALAILLGIVIPSCVRTPDPAPQPGLAVASSVVASSAAPTIQPDQRPAEWAQPIEKPGLPNLHKVSDDLYRGAQPDAEGFRQLKAMGIKTVVDLRAEHSDRKELRDTGLEYEEIPMHAWHAEDEDVVAFLKIVTDKNRTPVFVHCQHGADRTGTVCAAYRVIVCGWSKDEAIREMTEGGFGFHKTWQNLVKYIRGMDVEKLKREAGLSK
jgi:protein tyrosine/serine phosphatase